MKLLNIDANSGRVQMALFVTMMVWGVNLTAVKVLTESLDVLLVALLRMVLATFVLVLLWLRAGYSWPRWRGNILWLGACSAFFLVYLQQIIFAEGLARTSATNAALILSLGPMVSVLLEAAVFRRQVRMGQAVGVTLALLGVAMVILSKLGAQITVAALGDLLFFASVLSFASGGVMMQLLARHVPMLTIGVFVHALGASMLLLHASLAVHSPVQAIAEMTGFTWSLVLFSAVLATGLGSAIWARGIKVLGVGQTASYLSWVPVFGVAFGVIFMGEELTTMHIIGGIFVLVGATISARSKPHRPG
ncbi:MAG: DMT family transporter [Rhodoferax sp.]|nr:DMT family transporter [Rhodoferax sp.]